MILTDYFVRENASVIVKNLRSQLNVTAAVSFLKNIPIFKERKTIVLSSVTMIPLE